MIQPLTATITKINSWLEKLQDFAHEKLIIQKFNNVWGFALLSFACIVMAALIYKLNFPNGAIFIAGLLGLSVLLVFFFSPKLGFMIVFAFSFFPAFLTRFLPGGLPFSTAIDLIIFVIFLGIIFQKAIRREASWRNINHPISYGYLIYLLLLLVQLFNPNMSSIAGWGFVFRKFLVYMMIYLISLHVFQSIRFMRVYIGIWLSFAAITAVYAVYQEWFGMPAFEEAWVRADLGRYVLFRLGDGFRKFSFLSDPTDFGILMACSAVSSIILALGPFKKRYKLLFLVISVFMLLGVVYSGTRTATLMVISGILLFALMTINSRRTLVISFLAIGILGFILFTPYLQGKTVERLRTAFELKENASLNVRDVNRKLIQPYIYSHPIGGGLATSGKPGEVYNPEHRLAGFPPDSSYLRTALEMGWIGLLIVCGVYLVILITGVSGYYRSKSKEVRTYFAVFLVFIYMLFIGQYAQFAIGLYPGVFLYYPGIAFLIGLKALEAKGQNIVHK